MAGLINSVESRADGAQRLLLIPHETSERGGVDAISVEVGCERGALSLRYEITGDIASIVLPDVESPERADGLWRRTCLEAFISDGEAYCEFNYSPSTQWAAYHFARYRSGMAPVEMPAPQINRTGAAEQFHLYTELPLANTPLQGKRPWRLGLSAVIEHRDGAMSYWALRHDDGPPDFHRASCFTAQIP